MKLARRILFVGTFQFGIVVTLCGSMIIPCSLMIRVSKSGLVRFFSLIWKKLDQDQSLIFQDVAKTRLQLVMTGPWRSWSGWRLVDTGLQPDLVVNQSQPVETSWHCYTNSCITMINVLWVVLQHPCTSNLSNHLLRNENTKLNIELLQFFVCCQ